MNILGTILIVIGIAVVIGFGIATLAEKLRNK
jgi:hypothetical protein